MRIAVLAALLLAACNPRTSKPSAASDAAPPATADATSYLFAGEQVPRFVHWTKAGDLLGVSAGALWRLPGGELGADAILLDTRLPDGHGAGHERTYLSVFDSAGATERWLIGGEGFVSIRDPRTLAEVRRIAVTGSVGELVLAKNANVALVQSCEGFCTLTRIQLDSGAQASLGNVRGMGPPRISDDGKYAAFLRDRQLVVVADDAAQPVFSSGATTGFEPAAVVFQPEGVVLFGIGRQVGRWDAKTGKSITQTVRMSADSEPVFEADPVLGRIVASQAYSSDVFVYDGAALRAIHVPDPGCAGARPAQDDPTQLECPRNGTRLDAAGVLSQRPLGAVVRGSDKHVLREYELACEISERASGRIVAADTNGLCRAQFSTDGARVAWVGDDGTLQIHAFATPRPTAAPPFVLATAQVTGGTWLARWDDKVVAFGPNGYQQFAVSGASRGALEASNVAIFRLESHRLLGTDFAGAERLRVVDLGLGLDGSSGYQQLYTSGPSVVTNAYGHEARASVCHLDAGCTEIDIAPATEVKSYEAPWIVTSIVGEPDVPEQAVVYLRHDAARAPLRRIVVGRECAPGLVLDNGDRFACISGDQVVLFDSKTGEPLGDGAPLDLERAPAPYGISERPMRRKVARFGYTGGSIVGHDDAAVFLRTSEWLDDVVHIEARALPTTLDAGAASTPVPSVAVLGATFALVRYADGSVRIGGDVARAERSLACRRGNALLPWSACKRTSLR